VDEADEDVEDDEEEPVSSSEVGVTSLGISIFLKLFFSSDEHV
jgi:hypothetical protein